MSSRQIAGVKRRSGFTLGSDPVEEFVDERRPKMPRRSEANAADDDFSDGSGQEFAEGGAGDTMFNAADTSVDSVERRRAQVREASRRFRERKKHEIGMLEEKTSGLSKELSDARAALASSLARARYAEANLEYLSRSLAMNGPAAPIASAAAMQMEIDKLQARVATAEAQAASSAQMSRQPRSRRAGDGKESCAPTIFAAQYRALFTRLQSSLLIGKQFQQVVKDQQQLLRVVDMHLRASAGVPATLPVPLMEAIAVAAWRADNLVSEDLATHDDDSVIFGDPVKQLEGGNLRLDGDPPTAPHTLVSSDVLNLASVRDPMLTNPAIPAFRPMPGSSSASPEHKPLRRNATSPGHDGTGHNKKPTELPPLSLARPQPDFPVPKALQATSQQPLASIILQALSDVCCFSNESWQHVATTGAVTIFTRQEDLPVFSIKYEIVIPDVPAEHMTRVLLGNFTNEALAKDINPDVTQHCEVVRQLDADTCLVRRTDRYQFPDQAREYVYVVHVRNGLTYAELQAMSTPTILPPPTSFDDSSRTSPTALLTNPVSVAAVDIAPNSATRYYVGIARSVPPELVPSLNGNALASVRADLYEGWIVRSAFNGKGSVFLCVGQIDAKHGAATIPPDILRTSLLSIPGYVENTVRIGRAFKNGERTLPVPVFEGEGGFAAGRLPDDSSIKSDNTVERPQSSFTPAGHDDSSFAALAKVAEQELDSTSDDARRCHQLS